ncbi:MAG: PDZ domain-containing protein, partial [Rhodobacteraceae bacterium]|nr:PDZ domain-containing protein [Paracoccaceae bacterium]
AGDIIMAVDGEDTTAMELSDVVDRIRGPENTQVTLTVLRLDEAKNESLDIVITRQEIEVPATDWAMVPGTNVAYLRLTQFSANATDGIQAAVAEIKDAGAEAIVLDLRNNPGGLLEQAVKVTSQFLTTGNVLQEEDANGQRRVYRVQQGGVATDIPVVVLVNAGTASSAEIMAGALQDYDRAELVGETTFGTGTVLEPFMLNDGSALLLGTRQWLT